MSETEETRIDQLKAPAAVAIAVAGAYLVGWKQGYDRGLANAVQTETGVVGLEPLPEATQYTWVEPVATLALFTILLAITAWGVRGGFPRV